jgi:AraC-like DNA-binding protein
MAHDDGPDPPFFSRGESGSGDRRVDQDHVIWVWLTAGFSVAEIAQHLGIAETHVQRRLDALLRSGPGTSGGNE